MAFVETNTRSELHLHYAAVRSRLWPMPAPPVVLPLPPTEPPLPLVLALPPQEPPEIVSLCRRRDGHLDCRPHPNFIGPMEWVPGSLTMDAVINAVVDYFEISAEAIRVGRRRLQRICHARGMAIYLCRKFCHKTLLEIGRFFGGREHTTILYSYRCAEALLQKNEAFAEAFATLSNVLGEIPEPVPLELPPVFLWDATSESLLIILCCEGK